MIKWPWVSRKKYDDLQSTLKACHDLCIVRGKIINRLAEELKEARKNDHRDEKGRFVSTKDLTKEKK